MQGRQLLWLACCAATLCGRAAGSPLESPTPFTSEVPEEPSSSATGTIAGSHVEPSWDGPADGAAGSAVTATPGAGLRTAGTSARPGHGSPHGTDEAAAGTAAPAVTPSPGGTTAGTTMGTTVGKTAGTTAGTTARTVAGTITGSTEGTTAAPSSSGTPARPNVTVPARDGAGNSSEAIACHEVKDVREPHGTCLQLQEANTCKHFLDTKGSELWRAVCEEGARRVPSPCRIQLAASEVERDCLLLVLPGETDPTTDVLQKSHWDKLGIKSLKRGSVRSHQDFSRKTLIALVTSGLLLAFLGLAGYFLMRRRSWSPAAERLGEDPYYLDSYSQGNTMGTTASQERAEPPEKGSGPGGAQENGTGQAASPNGCSAKAHGLADTAM